MKKLENSVLNSILVIVAFVFNILIFAPMEIYYTNEKEIWFGIKDILPIVGPLALVVLIIMSSIAILLKGKKREVFIKIVFALLTTLYIQGNFLNFGYKVLDGSKIEWNTMIMKGTYNTCIWVLIISIPYCIKKLRKENNFKRFTSIVSIFILLIEIITLTALAVSKKEALKINVGLNNQNIFNLSKKENIIVFMSDTFEATYMNKILEEYPEYKEKLKDFTYFDNCTSVSFFTYSSMPTLLTGIECKVGNTLKENIDYCFDNSILYDVLKENGYKTEIYTEKAVEPYNFGIDNQGEENKKTTLETKMKLSSKMYKYTGFRYLPHFLKFGFEINGYELYRIKAENKALNYKEKTYFLDDVEFNKELVTNGITTDSKEKMFKFYQLEGMHIPYYMTRNLEYNKTEEYARQKEETKRYNEAIASINLLCNYVEELKKTGIYEKTTIIFLADHGYDNRFNTNLLVKKANNNHEFKISSAPVSLIEDLVPTILNIATNSKEYGKDFFDYKEDEIRKRNVYDYTYQVSLFGECEYQTISKIVFQTEGHAKEKEMFKIIEEEYQNENKELTEKYKFGDIIKIDEIKQIRSANFIGITEETVDIKVPVGCNISNKAYLEVNTNKADKDVIANFKINKVYDSSHTINFKINEKTIHTANVTMFETPNISFKIPKEIWNSNDKLTIEIEIPNAKLGKNYETMMLAIQFGDIQFNIE